MITTNNTENIGSIKRKICGQWFIDFPKDIDLKNLKLYSQGDGECVVLSQLDSIVFIDSYYCQVNEKTFIKAYGIDNKKVTVLWLSE
jgi:hypothetical protein